MLEIKNMPRAVHLLCRLIKPMSAEIQQILWFCRVYLRGLQAPHGTVRYFYDLHQGENYKDPSDPDRSWKTAIIIYASAHWFEQQHGDLDETVPFDLGRKRRIKLADPNLYDVRLLCCSIQNGTCYRLEVQKTAKHPPPPVVRGR